MSKIGQALSEQDLPESQEPENYQRQYEWTAEEEEAFEQWARRLVPALPKEAF